MNDISKFRIAAPQVLETAIVPAVEQQTAMAAAVSESGLALERFNAISQAVSSDARLQARLELADAQAE